MQKHVSRHLSSFKNSIYKEKCGTFKKRDTVKETLSANFLRKCKKQRLYFELSVLASL